MVLLSRRFTALGWCTQCCFGEVQLPCLGACTAAEYQVKARLPAQIFQSISLSLSIRLFSRLSSCTKNATQRTSCSHSRGHLESLAGLLHKTRRRLWVFFFPFRFRLRRPTVVSGLSEQAANPGKENCSDSDAPP